MVPNTLRGSCLQPHEQLLWIDLQALCHGEQSEAFASWKEVAQRLGRPPSRQFYRVIKALQAVGAIVEDDSETFTLVVPEGDRPEEHSKDSSQNTEEIADRLSQQPRRKKTLSKADRKALIREAWNKHKPVGEIWAELDGSVPEAAYNAIESQTKYCQHDRDDYNGFMKRVCRGLAASNYWMEKRTATVKLWTVFGWLQYYKGETGLQDTEHRRVKELYDAGATRKAQSATFDSSDEAFLDWFHSLGAVEFTKVQRIETESRIDATLLERERPVTDTIRVYIDKETGKAVHWTNQEKLRFSYLPS